MDTCKTLNIKTGISEEHYDYSHYRIQYSHYSTDHYNLGYSWNRHYRDRYNISSYNSYGPLQDRCLDKEHFPHQGVSEFQIHQNTQKQIKQSGLTHQQYIKKHSKK